MVSISNLSILDEVSFVSYAMALLLLYSRMSFFWCFQGQVTFTLTQQFIFVGRPDTEAMELITKKSLRIVCTPEELEETIIIRLLTLG